MDILGETEKAEKKRKKLTESVLEAEVPAGRFKPDDRGMRRILRGE